MTYGAVRAASVALTLPALVLISGCLPGGAPIPGLSVSPALSGGNFSFVAQLSGSDEVPPVDTTGSGQFNGAIVINSTVIDFQLSVANLTDVTQVTINVGAVGTNGPAIFTLFDSAKQGTFTNPEGGALVAADLTPGGGVNTFADAVAAVRAGNTYVSVTTAANPNGEIRGQILGQGVP
jgi:hypothetical protein